MSHRGSVLQGSTQFTTVVLDSLDTLLSDTGSPTETYRFLSDLYSLAKKHGSMFTTNHSIHLLLTSPLRCSPHFTFTIALTSYPSHHNDLLLLFSPPSHCPPSLSPPTPLIRSLRTPPSHFTRFEILECFHSHKRTNTQHRTLGVWPRR